LVKQDRIESHPDVCNGKPVVRGTRISVSTVASYLTAGDTEEEILKAHPQLTRDDIRACLAFAQRISAAHTAQSAFS
jgi:uncharacterized protein (DUF433 family)